MPDQIGPVNPGQILFDTAMDTGFHDPLSLIKLESPAVDKSDPTARKAVERPVACNGIVDEEVSRFEGTLVANCAAIITVFRASIPNQADEPNIGDRIAYMRSGVRTVYSILSVERDPLGMAFTVQAARA